MHETAPGGAATVAPRGADALSAELLDLSHDAILVCDAAGVIESWNAGATRLYGWTADDAIGTVSEALLATQAVESRAGIDAALDRDGIWEGPLTQRRRDGAIVTVQARRARRTRPGGAVVLCDIHRDISAKVQAQAAEAAVGRQLALLTAHGAVAALYIDADHHYRWVTQAYAERYGLPQSAFAGQPVVDIAGAEAYEVFRPYAVRALAGETGRCELEVPYAHMPHQIVEVTYGPDRGADGRIEGIVVALTNVSARRAAEARAQSLEARLEFVADACDIGTWYSELRPLDAAAAADDGSLAFGMQTVDLILNDACRRHIGLAPGAPVDTAVVGARIFPEDRPLVAAAIARAIGDGGEYDVVYRTWLPHDDGVRWVRGIGRVAYDEHGAARRFDGITLDVTAQQRLEHMLRERESWFRALADDVPVALWQTDALHACTYVSRTWCEFTGTSLHDSLGDGWLGHVHPDDRAAFGDAFVASSARREPFALDYRLRRHDDVYRWVACLGMPRIGETGGDGGFVGCAIDVHERKLAELALIEDDRRKDEFLAVLAHELRNPLAPILTVVHLLGHEGATAEASRRALPMLQRQLQHLVRLVDDLLDVSRIRTGKLALRRAPTVVQDIVAQAAEASGLSETSSPRLFVHLPDRPIVVDGDATRLLQVLMNLLNNAAKFTPADGRIAIDVHDGRREVVLTVGDTGMGMEATLVPRVFDPFVQAAGAQDPGRSGLGIGLTLVRSLVELHGGRVRAHSAGPGLGSTFDVTLPMLADTTLSDAPAGRADRDPPTERLRHAEPGEPGGGGRDVGGPDHP